MLFENLRKMVAETIYPDVYPSSLPASSSILDMNCVRKLTEAGKARNNKKVIDESLAMKEKAVKLAELIITSAPHKIIEAAKQGRDWVELHRWQYDYGYSIEKYKKFGPPIENRAAEIVANSYFCKSRNLSCFEARDSEGGKTWTNCMLIISWGDYEPKAGSYGTWKIS